MNLKEACDLAKQITPLLGDDACAQVCKIKENY